LYCASASRIQGLIPENAQSSNDMLLHRPFHQQTKQQRAVMEENENWFDHSVWGSVAFCTHSHGKPAKP
jgi:hypothetical protein